MKYASVQSLSDSFKSRELSKEKIPEDSFEYIFPFAFNLKGSIELIKVEIRIEYLYRKLSHNHASVFTYIIPYSRLWR